MKTTYKTNLKGGVLIVSVGLGIVLISALTSPNVKATDPTFLGIAFIYLLIIIDVIFGNYVTISDKYLSTTDWFFFKQSVDLNDISRVSYSPQFIGGMGAKMLTVYFRKGGQLKTLNIGSNHFFSKRTMANIVTEITRQNPGVQLDESVQMLIEKNRSQEVTNYK